MEKRPTKLLEQVRNAIRLKRYSLHTEQSSVTWINRYIFFHDKHHPKDMEGAEIEAFLTHLATPPLQQGSDIRTVQELLGHKDVKTARIYTHVLNRGRLAVRSPLDYGALFAAQYQRRVSVRDHAVFRILDPPASGAERVTSTRSPTKCKIGTRSVPKPLQILAQIPSDS